MFKYLSLFGIALFLCFSVSLFAGEKKIKLGKIEKKSLELTECPIDSNAHAYYIFDKGYSRFLYVEGFKLQYNRHFRIKILDETAFDEAQIEVRLYKGNSGNDESVGGIKAYTYNLEEGNIVTTRMDKKSIIREKKSKHWDVVKFALPNVKAGSVIEVKYETTSDFWSRLGGWYFQYSIPVLKSNYQVEIPEYYKYKQFPHGYIAYQTGRSEGRGSILFPTGNLDYTTDIYEYSAVDVPAFPVGEYLTSVDNYISNVEFELASIEIPGSVYENYTTSWAEINKQLLEAESFGLRLSKNRCFQDQSEMLNLLVSDEKGKMQAAFAYMKNHTKWNDYNSIYTSQSFNKTLETGLGNVADINLGLVALMRRMGLQANPVVLSTRSNGFVLEYRPSMNNLNYVIASCTVEGETYIMDATNDWSGLNMIPTRCLNGNGLVVQPNKVTWLPLASGAQYKTSSNYFLSLNEDGVFTGQAVNRYYEYASYIERNNVKAYESLEKYIEDVEEDNEGLTVNDFKVNNVDSLHKNIEDRLQVEIDNKVEVMGDLMIFAPTLYEAMGSNPLKLEVRMYPVEYYFPINKTTKMIIKIPENYEVESLPKGVMYKSPSGSCAFKYLLVESAGTISVVSHYERNQIIFPYTQYDELKQFYETIVTKQNEKIVLKKKAAVSTDAPIASVNE